MKMFVLKRIQSVIESVASSTDLVAQFGGIVARVNGRNSPYISHRNVEFEGARDGEHVPGAAVIVRNHRSALAIASGFQTFMSLAGELGRFLPELDVVSDVEEAVIPASMLVPVGTALAEIGFVEVEPDDLRLVCVRIPRVVGWDGPTPIFQKISTSVAI